jgi:16S rRNA C967 or C1407 C5-methylase (RsmB/RsmF family)
MNRTFYILAAPEQGKPWIVPYMFDSEEEALREVSRFNTYCKRVVYSLCTLTTSEGYKNDEKAIYYTNHCTFLSGELPLVQANSPL